MMDSEDKKIDIEGVDPRELYGPQNIYLEQMQELHPNLKSSLADLRSRCSAPEAIPNGFGNGWTD